jgi:hypothetical protein
MLGWQRLTVDDGSRSPKRFEQKNIDVNDFATAIGVVARMRLQARRFAPENVQDLKPGAFSGRTIPSGGEMF